MNKKVMALRIITTVFMLVLFVVTPVFADIPVNFPTADPNGIGTINTSAQKVWGTVVTIVQILAFAAVVFAGLRYMFASADQKADIKKGLTLLVIGAVLVFGTTLVIQFVVNAVDEVI